MHEHVPTDRHRLRGMLVLPPILALVYPFLLQGFHASVAAILLRVGGAVAWSAAAITLILAFAMPISALFIAMSLAAVDMPTAAQRKARKVALLTVAAPPIFVFLGVVLDMLHSPIPDTWVAGWAAAYIVVTFADNTSPITPTPAVVPSWLRYAHGVSAACIILMFLLLHLTNHLLLFSPFLSLCSYSRSPADSILQYGERLLRWIGSGRFKLPVACFSRSTLLAIWIPCSSLLAHFRTSIPIGDSPREPRQALLRIHGTFGWCPTTGSRSFSF
jgi:hypothetical protein